MTKRIETYRGPTNKIIWTVADQRRALEIGFFVGVRVQIIQEAGFGACKYDRAHINRLLSGTLTKPMFLDLFNEGVRNADPFWEKLHSFIEQQTAHGYVGAWEDQAKTFGGVRNADLTDRKARMARMHPKTRNRANREAYERAFGRPAVTCRNISSVLPSPSFTQADLDKIE